MRCFLLKILVFLFFVNCGKSQSFFINKGKLDSLRSFYKKDSKVMGYSVQIKISQKKSEILEERNKFVLMYPNVKLYQVYEQPYFKARVGQFYNRVEAEGLKRKVKKHFPFSHVVKVEVNTKYLLGNLE